jgi:hypothetical protein
MDQERRFIAADGLRIERREGQPARLRGHAAVFNSLSEDLGGFRERVLPGAFRDAIARDDVRALWNHDANFILGRNRSGTLSLAEDQTGLAIDCVLPDTQTIRDLVAAPIERGDVTQMSFAFSVMPDGQDWSEDADGMMIRTLKALRLYDISPVVYPAYQATDVALRDMRSVMAARKTIIPVNLMRARERLARL